MSRWLAAILLIFLGVGLSAPSQSDAQQLDCNASNVLAVYSAFQSVLSKSYADVIKGAEQPKSIADRHDAEIRLQAWLITMKALLKEQPDRQFRESEQQLLESQLVSSSTGMQAVEHEAEAAMATDDLRERANKACQANPHLFIALIPCKFWNDRYGNASPKN